MDISISAIIGIIIAVVIGFIIVQIVLKWLAKLGIIADETVRYTLWGVAVILVLLFAAFVFHIPVPVFHW